MIHLISLGVKGVRSNTRTLLKERLGFRSGIHGTDYYSTSTNYCQNRWPLD